MPGLGGRGAAGAGATSAGLEGAAALDFGAAALRAIGFAFLSADFFGALFLVLVADMVVLDPRYRAPLRDSTDLIVFQTAERGEADVLCTNE